MMKNVLGKKVIGTEKHVLDENEERSNKADCKSLHAARFLECVAYSCIDVPTLKLRRRGRRTCMKPIRPQAKLQPSLLNMSATEKIHTVLGLRSRADR